MQIQDSMPLLITIVAVVEAIPLAQQHQQQPIHQQLKAEKQNLYFFYKISRGIIRTTFLRSYPIIKVYDIYLLKLY